MKQTIFCIAGEPSGDLFGKELILALNHLDPNLIFQGIGGPLMESTGFQNLVPFKDMQVMGFLDVILNYFTLRKHFFTIVDRILSANPIAVIFIDYPGFNLRLAKELRKRSYKGKLIQFVSPSVWAWRASRIQTMEQSLDLLLTILPFEPEYYAKTTLKTLYVGNPTLTLIPKEKLSFREKYQVPASKKILALFPGSRPSEIKRHLPLFLKSAEKFSKMHPEFVVAVALSDPAYRELCLKQPVIIVEPEDRFALMQNATCALAKSGTVILELALTHVPSVVAYQMPLINYWIAKYILRLKLAYYSLPNILLQREIFPENYHTHLSAENLALQLDLQLKNELHSDIKELEAILTTKNAFNESAHAIYRIL